MIEPCCVEQKVCWMLREEKNHAVMMQTNGDVTLEHWMKGVMLLSGERPRTVTIAVPELTAAMQRVVCRFLKPEWVKTVRILSEKRIVKSEKFATAAEPSPTEQPAVSEKRIVKSEKFATAEPSPTEQPAVSEELLGFIREGRVELAADEQARLGLLIFSGTDGTVVIQGEMLEAVTPGLRMYSGLFGNNGSKAVMDAIGAFEALFRSRRYEVAALPQQTGQEKPKRVRKGRVKK